MQLKKTRKNTFFEFLVFQIFWVFQDFSWKSHFPRILSAFAPGTKRRYEKTHAPYWPLRPKNLKTYCRNMFGWFGEVGGTRKNHTHRCVSSFYYLAERKVRKTTKIIFRVFNTCNSSQILLFCSRNPKYFVFGNLKRRAPEFGSKSAPSKVDLEPYGAIWCQFGCQFSSPKTKNSS